MIKMTLRFAIFYQIIAALILSSTEIYGIWLRLHYSLFLNLKERTIYFILLLTYLAAAKFYWEIQIKVSNLLSNDKKLEKSSFWGLLAIFLVIIHEASIFFYQLKIFPNPTSLISEGQSGDLYKIWYFSIPYLDKFFNAISPSTNIFFIYLLYLIFLADNCLIKDAQIVEKKT